MTDLYDQAFVNVGLNLLRADPGLVVFDSKVPNGSRAPYVLVYTSLDRPDVDGDLSFNGRSTVWVARWICHCVGEGEDGVAARAVAQRVRTQLLDVQPVVLDANNQPLPFACGLIRKEPSVPPTRNETLGGLVMDAVETYRLRATTS